MSNENITCPNCGAENHIGANYCSNCGQKFEEKLNFKALFYNTISNYFSFDARFLKSIIPLLFKPGFIAKEFVNGKRLRYLHPGQMYLFVSVIFFFVFSFYVRESRQSIDKTSQEMMKGKELYSSQLDSIIKADSLDVRAREEINKLANTYNIKELKNLDSLAKSQESKNTVNFDFDQKYVDSLIAISASDVEIYRAMGMDDNAGYLTRRLYSQGLKLYRKMDLGQVYQTFVDSIPIAMFVLMPLFAFILKLFYYKRGNYSHHLVFSFYFFCFLFTVFSLVLSVNRFYDIPDGIDWLIILSTFLYLWRGIIRFYESGWFGSLLKSMVISGLYLFFVVPLSIVLLIFIAFFFY